MKKVLIVTYKPVLPIDGGDKFRIYHIADILKENYAVDILCPGGQNTFNLLKKANIFGSIYLYRVNVYSIFYEALRNIFLRRPIQMSFFETSRSRQIVSNVADNYDIIYCHLFRGLMMVPERCHKKVVWDMCDSVANASARIKIPKTIKQLLFKFDYKKIYNYERSSILTIGDTIVINSNDLNGLGLSKDLVHVVNNGHGGPIVKKDQRFDIEGKWLLFIGNMNTYPNRASLSWFIDKVLPELNGELKLLVVGSGSTRFIKNLDMLNALESYNELSDIVDRNIIGGIAPMIYGTGVQNKVLDYFALGIPAIISPIAKDGLTVRNGEEVIVCSTIDEYKTALTAIMNLDYDIEKLTDKAGTYLVNNHTWQSAGNKLVSIIDNRISELNKE